MGAWAAGAGVKERVGLLLDDRGQLGRGKSAGPHVLAVCAVGALRLPRSCTWLLAPAGLAEQQRRHGCSAGPRGGGAAQGGARSAAAGGGGGGTGGGSSRGSAACRCRGGGGGGAAGAAAAGAGAARGAPRRARCGARAAAGGEGGAPAEPHPGEPPRAAGGCWRGALHASAPGRQRHAGHMPATCRCAAFAGRVQV